MVLVCGRYNEINSVHKATHLHPSVPPPSSPKGLSWCLYYTNRANISSNHSHQSSRDGGHSGARCSSILMWVGLHVF